MDATQLRVFLLKIYVFRSRSLAEERARSRLSRTFATLRNAAATFLVQLHMRLARAELICVDARVISAELAERRENRRPLTRDSRVCP